MKMSKVIIYSVLPKLIIQENIIELYSFTVLVNSTFVTAIVLPK